jgi:hypothetical protein
LLKNSQSEEGKGNSLLILRNVYCKMKEGCCYGRVEEKGVIRERKKVKK